MWQKKLRSYYYTRVSLQTSRQKNKRNTTQQLVSNIKLVTTEKGTRNQTYITHLNPPINLKLNFFSKHHKLVWLWKILLLRSFQITNKTEIQIMVNVVLKFLEKPQRTPVWSNEIWHHLGKPYQYLANLKSKAKDDRSNHTWRINYSCSPYNHIVPSKKLGRSQSHVSYADYPW